METTIVPRFVETRAGKSGKTYWSIEDQVGQKYTCFEQAFLAHLQIGRPVTVEVIENKGFKNIRAVKGFAKINDAPKPVPFAKEKNEKLACVLTSYAKDLVINLCTTDSDLENMMLVASKAVLSAYQELLKKL